MKTMTVLFVLSCISLCLVNTQRTHVYNILTHQTKTRMLDKQTAVAEPKEGEIQEIKLEYPPVCNQSIELI